MTDFLRLGMFEAAANIAQFITRCPPPEPPPSLWFPFPPPRPRRRRRRRRRRRGSPKPTPSSVSATQLSTEVDEIIDSIEQLPIIVKSPNREKKLFKEFDQDDMCVTIGVLAKSYSPGHVHNPPPLAIEYQPNLHMLSEAGATPSIKRNASDAQSVWLQKDYMRIAALCLWVGVTRQAPHVIALALGPNPVLSVVSCSILVNKHAHTTPWFHVPLRCYLSM